jgi:hypothetical protein
LRDLSADDDRPICETDGWHENILFSVYMSRRVPCGDMSPERERVISVTLTESEWKAFVARHPQPVHWLRELIRGETKAARDEQPRPARSVA